MHVDSPNPTAQQPAVPPRIGRLYELANNLWWSWHEDGRQVFRSLDYALWRATGHNPIKQLRRISPEKLRSAANDLGFLELYDSVMMRFDNDMLGESAWFSKAHHGRLNGPVAYFSPEFAIHGSLPIYAGGLGVMAGDICKEASDLALPMVGVGFMYPLGYFQQRMSGEGWQEEIGTQLSFLEAPISPCPFPEACGPMVSVDLADKTLYVTSWLVRVGRVSLYLLDTNVDANAPSDRTLSARLYTANPEERLQQLIVLGVCGVRVLRALGVNPSVWHANEDHTSFMMLERLREEIRQGEPFERALANVRSTTVFTTHTPVAAGHNILGEEQLGRHLRTFVGELGIDSQRFFEFGRYAGLERGKFSLTAMALRLAGQPNAVSRIHGRVTRRMWHVLWPQKREDEVPIIHITNGVHLPTWQAPEIGELCRKYMRNAPRDRQDDPAFWRCIDDVPDEEFWQVHLMLKTRLIRLLQDRAQQRWAQTGASTQQMMTMGTLLDPYALTIAFARRFTEYKRPGLILSDLERLKKVVNDPEHPVQVIFAGKSHPADQPGKELLRQVYLSASDRLFQCRLAFVEDYDMHLAREMVRGVDVWLNVPRRLQEASGTSGMKASMNGVLNLSVRDGWWDEGYNEANGWAVGDSTVRSPREEDRADAESLYSILEKQIVPIYYDRDRQGVPHGWVKAAKEAIRSVTPQFAARRMMKEYAECMYLRAAKVGPEGGPVEASRREK